jgi:hypothetical protein
MSSIFHRYFHFFFASMAKGNRLEDRGMRVQFPAGATFLHTVYTDSDVHQTSCPIASEHSSQGAKRLQSKAGHLLKSNIKITFHFFVSHYPVVLIVSAPIKLIMSSDC